MDIKELINEKQTLLIKAEKLVKLKKQLYSNVDITSKPSAEERGMNEEISKLYSHINSIVFNIRKAKKS